MSKIVLLVLGAVPFLFGIQMSKIVLLVLGAVCLFLSRSEAHSKHVYTIQNAVLLENPVIDTPSHLIDASSHFDLTFGLQGAFQDLKLTLEPNHDIFPEGAQIQYLDPQGRIKRAEPIERSRHKVFRGSVSTKSTNGRWESGGWARVSIVRDGLDPLFEGVFSYASELYHVQLLSTFMRRESELAKNLIAPDLQAHDEERLVVYHHSETGIEARSELNQSSSLRSACRADELTLNALVNRNVDPASSNSLFARQGRQNPIGLNLTDSIGDRDGCPNSRRMALVGIATDCSYTAAFNSTGAVRENIINVVNAASELFERSFNIALGLQNLTISDPECPTESTEPASWNVPCSTGDLSWRLNHFSSWRGAIGDNNAYWTLMTACQTGAEVGVAWIGQLCRSGIYGSHSEPATGASVVVRTSGEWQVFAHESGHVFGAVHDCTSDTCDSGMDTSSQCCPLSSSTCDADGQYIMNPSSGIGLTQFSPCTVGNICSALGSGRVVSSCLTDSNSLTSVMNNQCGNGIVEAGEECDCGGEEFCGNNSCCDPTTCRFRDGAVCDDSVGSCCTNCHFSAQGTVCRSNRGTCDVEETCSGNSSSCPGDSFEPDGQSCNGGYCLQGQCRHRDTQPSWFDDHKPLVIGLVAGLGGLIVLLIFISCVISHYRRRRLYRFTK